MITDLSSPLHFYEMTSRRKSLSIDNTSNKESTKRTEFVNVFQNDGSFLEMFKKMQNASQSESGDDKTDGIIEPKEVPLSEKERTQPTLPMTSKSAPVAFIGRRRGSKALPVGKVKKLKTDDQKKPTTTDAWGKYLEEVKKYKETYCDSEAKNRSLVK